MYEEYFSFPVTVLFPMEQILPFLNCLFSYEFIAHVIPNPLFKPSLSLFKYIRYLISYVFFLLKEVFI